MIKQRALICTVVLLVAFGAVYVGIWPPLRVVCAIVGLGTGGWLAARLMPAASVLERTLDGIFAVAVLSMVLGLLLNALPGGLTRHSFAAGWALIGVVLLVLSSGGRSLPLPRGSVAVVISPRLIVACVMVGAAAVAAFLIADAGVRKANSRPSLALAALAYGGSTAKVQITSVNDGGPYGLTVLADGRAPSAPARTLFLGSSGSRTIVLHLPKAECYWSIQLTRAGGFGPVGVLKLWVGTSSAGLLRHGAALPPLTGTHGPQLPAGCGRS